jgi:TFIIF-interacting CTD phosphatase-like protein
MLNICKSKKKIKRPNSGPLEEKQKRIQLFVDLDNTLIYSSLNKLENYKNFCKLNNKFYVYKRPHLDNFLNTVNSYFNLKLKFIILKN